MGQYTALRTEGKEERREHCLRRYLVRRAWVSQDGSLEQVPRSQ